MSQNRMGLVKSFAYCACTSLLLLGLSSHTTMGQDAAGSNAPDLPERWLLDPHRALSQSEMERINELVETALSKAEEGFVDEEMPCYWHERGPALEFMADSYACGYMVEPLRTALRELRLPNSVQRGSVVSNRYISFKDRILATVAMIDTPEAVETLLEVLLSDDHVEVRSYAQEYLSMISSREHLSLKDDAALAKYWEGWWKDAKQNYISKIHEKARALVATLCDRSKTDSERCEVATGLVCGTPEWCHERSLMRTRLLVPYFQKILEDPNESADLKVGILDRMSRIATNDTIPILIDMLMTDNDKVFWYALWHLRNKTEDVKVKVYFPWEKYSLRARGIRPVPFDGLPENYFGLKKYREEWGLPDRAKRAEYVARWKQVWEECKDKVYATPGGISGTD